MTRPSQSDFIRECERLHKAQLAATTADEREQANHEMGLFLRYHATGRLQEWFARRAELQP